jgi:putative transposase
VARPLRIEFEDAIYHITARGNRREQIFDDRKDYERFLALLSQSLGRYRVEVHAFALLPNHFHLLARTLRANLSRWMHWLMVSYSVSFNRRHGKVGHLFQGRYKSLLVEGGSYLLGLSRYLHLNPVRGRVIGAGDPRARRQRLRQYRWSSYQGYAGLAPQVPFVHEELILGEFEVVGRRNTKLRYRRFVEEGLLREIENPEEEAQWQSVLGSETFLQRIKDKMQPLRHRRREVKALRHGTFGPDAKAVAKHVGSVYRIPVQRLLQESQYGQEAPSVAMWAIWQTCDLSLREIGALFGGMDYAAVAQRILRIKRAGASRADLQKLLKQCQNI